jgi:uncharacterized protein YceK
MVRALGSMNLSLFMGITLTLSGCASMRPYDPGPGKRAAAALVEDTYTSGAPVNITIANLSGVYLFYPDGFCSTRLQKKDRGGWVTVSDPSKTCSVEAAFLEPGQAVVHQFRLPEGITDGVYRVALPMPIPDEATQPEPELITPIFKVERSVMTTASGQ